MEADLVAGAQRFDPDGLLYHYTTREAALGAILPTGFIRLGLTRYVNDPRERKRWRIVPVDDTDGTSDCPKTAAEIISFSDDVASIAQATTKMLCLTRDTPTSANDRWNVFSRGYGHSPMWAHYAGGHSGVCLVFDRLELEKAVRETLDGKGELWGDSVFYADEAADEINAFSIRYSRVVELGLEGAVAEHVAAHHQALLFRKNTAWAGEWEYRWVLRNAEPSPEFVPIKSALRQVIRGDSFPDSDLDIYRHLLARYPDVGEGLVVWLNGGPHLLPGHGEGGLHMRAQVWAGDSAYADGRPGPHPDPLRRDE